MRRHLNFDFVGRYRRWFAISAAVVVISLLSLLLRGLDLSIEFTGGSSFTIEGVQTEVTTDDLEDVAADAGAEQVTAQLVETGGQVTGGIVRTEAIEPGSDTEVAVIEALGDATAAESVEANFVGPTWGQRISAKMAQALLVFLIIVVAYISLRLEFKMSGAAILALFHDMVFTAGIYSIFQFRVSPATVIALLTILGYSLYDTVIVFDRVHETTDRLGGAGRRSYGQAVNTAMNDVLWRSVNTTVTSGLPVAALVLIGSQALGATTLQDLALALFIGIVSGAYSSLFIAGPFLALWKEREPKYARLAERVQRAGAAPEAREEPEEEPAEEPEPEEPQLQPRGYVRGPGRTPRSKRG